jgi:hypothetical protein
MTVRVNGVGPLVELTASCGPLGTQANVRFTVFG